MQSPAVLVMEMRCNQATLVSEPIMRAHDGRGKDEIHARCDMIQRGKLNDAVKDGAVRQLYTLRRIEACIVG